MKWNIGDMQFNSKDACRKYVRKLLSEIGNNTIDKNHEHFEFLVNLVKKHPDATVKIGFGIDKFIISNDKLNKKAHMLEIVRVDGSTIDISWIICCGTVLASDLTMAMRNSVEFQTRNFKEKCNDMCEACKTKTVLLDVHHHEVNFDTIKREFIALTKIEVPTSFDSDEAYRPILKEGPFKVAFLDYHQSRAKYRLLCKTCHRKIHAGLKPSINRPIGCVL